jgi:hypothetical protein
MGSIAARMMQLILKKNGRQLLVLLQEMAPVPNKKDTS